MSANLLECYFNGRGAVLNMWLQPFDAQDAGTMQIIKKKNKIK